MREAVFYMAGLLTLPTVVLVVDAVYWLTETNLTKSCAVKGCPGYNTNGPGPVLRLVKFRWHQKRAHRLAFRLKTRRRLNQTEGLWS